MLTSELSISVSQHYKIMGLGSAGICQLDTEGPDKQTETVLCITRSCIYVVASSSCHFDLVLM